MYSIVSHWVFKVKIFVSQSKTLRPHVPLMHVFKFILYFAHIYVCQCVKLYFVANWLNAHCAFRCTQCTRFLASYVCLGSFVIFSSSISVSYFSFDFLFYIYYSWPMSNARQTWMHSILSFNISHQNWVIVVSEKKSISKSVIYNNICVFFLFYKLKSFYLHIFFCMK